MNPSGDDPNPAGGARIRLAGRFAAGGPGGRIACGEAPASGLLDRAVDHQTGVDADLAGQCEADRTALGRPFEAGALFVREVTFDLDHPPEEMPGGRAGLREAHLDAVDGDAVLLGRP